MPSRLPHADAAAILTAPPRRQRVLYPFSGSFALPNDMPLTHAGWIPAPDPTLTPAAIAVAHTMPAHRLALATVRLWHAVGGDVWLMPGSHWAYEFDFGTPQIGDLLGTTDLPSADIDALATTAAGDAIVFKPVEQRPFAALLDRLLATLSTSDYRLAFPAADVVGIVHHHRQLWWTAAASLAGVLTAAAEPA